MLIFAAHPATSTPELNRATMALASIFGRTPKRFPPGPGRPRVRYPQPAGINRDPGARALDDATGVGHAAVMLAARTVALFVVTAVAEPPGSRAA